MVLMVGTYAYGQLVTHIGWLLRIQRQEQSYQQNGCTDQSQKAAR